MYLNDLNELNDFSVSIAMAVLGENIGKHWGCNQGVRLMARTAILRGFLDRIGVPAVKSSGTWSVIKIEKMLKDLNIIGYEFDYEPRVVRLQDRNQLMLVLCYMMPFEVSDDFDLAPDEFNGVALVQAGNWQFESRA